MASGIPEPLKWKNVKKRFQKKTANSSRIKRYRGKTRLEVFWMRIEINDKDDCWPWLGSTRGGGYGVFKFGRKKYYVHRLMWMLRNQEDLQSDDLVLHHCDNPPCCNPNHIYKGDQSDNIQDAWDRDRFPDGYAERCRQKLKEWWSSIPKDKRREIIESGDSLKRNVDV